MSSVTEALRKIKFIEATLPKLIVEQNDDFKGFIVVNCRAELNKHLDGFMSAIYNVQLTLKSPKEAEWVKNTNITDIFLASH